MSTTFWTRPPEAWALPLLADCAGAPPAPDPPAPAVVSPEVADAMPRLKIRVMESTITWIGAKFCPPTRTATLALVFTVF